MQNATSWRIAQQPISSIYLQVSCVDKRNSGGEQRKVIIPVLVKVLDVNDNAPRFSSPVYRVQVDELAPVGTVVLDSISAIDLDSASNALIDYALVPERARPPATTSSTTTSTTTTTALPPLRMTTLAAVQDAPPAAAQREPTINLNSEPIVNGPMVETDEDEASDEAALAALNATDTSAGEPIADESSRVLSTAAKLSRKRRQTRAQLIASATTTLGDNAPATTTTLLPTQTTRQQQRAKDLWTNLMAASDARATSVAFQPTATATTTTMQTEPARPLDSSDYFALELAPHTNTPIIRLKRPLDYETKRVHVLTIEATDRAARLADRLSSHATVIVRVMDGDDQPPAFVLEQSNCATNSLPSLGGNSATSVMPPVFMRRQGDVAAPAAKPSGAQNSLHKNFKVTEENFEFGDGRSDVDLAGDDSAHEGVGVTIDANAADAQLGPAVRARRVPATQQIAITTTTAARARPTLALSTRAQQSTTQATSDYGCLPTSLNNGQAEYFATVMSGDSDYLLRVSPQAIKARDRDELNAPIKYSFVNGTPSNYSHYFAINAVDATIKQVAAVERRDVARFVMYVQAQEQLHNKLASVAKLTVDVAPSDKSPPVLVPNSYAGFVEENAPVGAHVFVSAQDARNPSGARSNLLRVLVLESAAGASYEFETTSHAFKVNKDGYVYVNAPGLDRDAPPSQQQQQQHADAVHRFQVTARQVGVAQSSARSMSSPVSINVTLLDLNDNAPAFANESLVSVQLTANAAAPANAVRQVTRLRALDSDEPENARAIFAILHVSNGGKNRFRVNSQTGELDALGRFVAGEQFSLTVQVSDELGRGAQAIVEALVVPGPNAGGPQFVVGPSAQATDATRPHSTGDDDDAGKLTLVASGANSLAASAADNARGYSAEVNEAAAPHTPVLQVRAVDPENDPITYSILDGNVNSDFYINSKTGVIYVNNKLDREEVSAYTLLVQARDSGGLHTMRPVSIAVTDANDQNPEFSKSHYEFEVAESAAPLPLTIGRVEASDSDAGDNGRVTYRLENNEARLFAIDAQTGQVSLLQPLDYESTKSHTLLVRASDAGDTPRSSTCTVVVRVRDVQDELPYFERYYYEARVPENLANARLAQVQARDPDSVAHISYVLKSGDASLFRVDPASGVVSSVRGLDYEHARTHTLLVGVAERPQQDNDEAAAEAIARSLASGAQLERSPIARVDVTVLDVNDNAPRFTAGNSDNANFDLNNPNSGGGVRVPDSTPLGAQIVQLHAQDRDASEPNNQVRYELAIDAKDNSTQQVTNAACASLFMVDATSGAVLVKADLKAALHVSECQLCVRARDLATGEGASLSSVTSIMVYIDHIAELSPAAHIGFADAHVTVELAENAAPNTLVKRLPVINKPKQVDQFAMSCEIISGNELARFYVSADNESRDCELRTRDQPIDYELKQRYSLTVRLNSLSGQQQQQQQQSGKTAVAPTDARTLAHVQVNILDLNDNRPTFHLPARYAHLTSNKFLAAVSADAASDTQVLQVRATDADSSQSSGLVTYKLLNELELDNRFKVDPIDGIIRTSRPVEDVPATRLPLRLRVLARDNPEPSAGDALDAVADVLVNTIDDRNRLALVLRDVPSTRALECKDELLGVIQQRTGLISALEKVESLKQLVHYAANSSTALESDVGGTDFWFHLVEPGTFRVVTTDDVRVRAALLEPRGMSSLADVLAQQLSMRNARVRLPYAGGMPYAPSLAAGGLGRSLAGHTSSQSRTINSIDIVASGLIVLALFIAIISALQVVCQCDSSRAAHKRHRSGDSSSTRTSSAASSAATSQARALKEKMFLQQQLAAASQLQAARSPNGVPLDPSTFNSFPSALSTLMCAQQHQLKSGDPSAQQQQQQPPIGSSQFPFAAIGSKEYETQMLRMSVLFDDNHSVDERSLQQQNSEAVVSQKLNY